MEDWQPSSAYLATDVIWANPVHEITHESQRTKTEMREGFYVYATQELSMLVNIRSLNDGKVLLMIR